MKSSFKVHASATPNQVDQQSSKKRPGHVTSRQEPGNLTTSLCDLNFCFGKGDINLFTMPVVTWSAAVIRTINTILTMRVSWSDVTRHQSSIARSTWLGVAEGRTLKLDFVVKKWQDQKLIFGILIYALCRFQNHKNPVGRIDTLNLITHSFWEALLCYVSVKLSQVKWFWVKM